MKKLLLRLPGLAAAGWLTAGSLAAAEPDDGAAGLDASPLKDGSMAGYYIWVIVALAIVLGLIILLLKWLSARNRGWGGSRSLRSLGGIPLGQNKSMQVLELAGRVYIVGVGDTVTLLDKIADAEEAKAIIDSMDEQLNRSWNPQSVSEFIARFRKRNDAALPADEPWQEAASFQEMLNGRLKRQAEHKQQVEELLKEQNHNDRLMDE